MEKIGTDIAAFAIAIVIEDSTTLIMDQNNNALAPANSSISCVLTILQSTTNHLAKF